MTDGNNASGNQYGNPKKPPNQSTPADANAPKPPIDEYNGSLEVGHEAPPVTDPTPFTPPKVPGGDGSKGTSVDTPSLKLLAKVIDENVIPQLKNSRLNVAKIDVRASASVQGIQLRKDVNDVNNNGGYKKSVQDALYHVETGLTDISTALRRLSHDYETTEEASKVTAEKFKDALGNGPTDFDLVIKDGGGSSSGGSSPGGSDSGGSDSGGSGSGGSGSGGSSSGGSGPHTKA